jgi:hypothetical protein
MAIVFRDKRQLGEQVRKFVVEGEPLSNSEDLSIADIFETYKKLGAKRFADLSDSRVGVLTSTRRDLKSSES